VERLELERPPLVGQLLEWLELVGQLLERKLLERQQLERLELERLELERLELVRLAVARSELGLMGNQSRHKWRGASWG
jgi:hypothetical protein